MPETYTGLGEERVYISSGEHGGAAGSDHAEDHMLDALNILPKEFWITNTPCPVCARTLMQAYASSSTKAEINVSRFYKPPPGNKQAQSKAIDCLAKMMYEGFKIYSWDWPAFYEEFLKGGNEKCINVLKSTAENNEKFNALKQQFDTLNVALAEAEKRSKSQQWITNRASKCQP